VVKVLDFGIAKMMRYDAAKTETGEVKGKLMYMPPEQLLGEKLDRRADIFAVGCMLWEAATGARMWANVSQANLMHRLISGDIPRPSEIGPVDPELERIILRATAASPDDRYETALAMQQELDAYLESTRQRAVLRDIGATLAETYKADRQERARAIKEALRHNSVPPPPSDLVDLKTSSDPRLESPPKKRAALPLLLLLALAIIVILLSLRAFRTPAPVPAQSVAAPSALVPAPTMVVVSPPRPTTTETAAAPSSEPSSAPTTTASHTKNGTSNPGIGKRLSPSGAAAATPAAPTGAAAPSADCSPPYYFDHGIKTYKPQCL